jgi:hypothetical protein
LSAAALCACAPGAPAPRVDLQRVAAEVVATAAARPSPAAAPAVGKATTPETAVAPITPTSDEASPATATAMPAELATATAAPAVTATASSVAGATPTAPTTPTPRPAPSSPAAVAAAAAAGPHGGVLGPGGTFARFGFDYPGDRSVYTVNVHVDPDDAGVLKNAGFLVYGPGGEEIVRGGAQPGRRPNLSADVIHTRPGRYLVLVHNYDPAKAITYQVELLPGPPPGR